MARPTPSILACDLLLGYLATQASLDTGVPTTTLLPRFRMDSGATMPMHPCMAFAGMESAESSGARRTVTVAGLLHYLLKNSDADAPTDAVSTAAAITEATATGYLEAIEARLRDRDSLFTYLGALSSTAREGWQIISYRILRQPEIKRSDDTQVNAITLALAAELTFAWPI